MTKPLSSWLSVASFFLLLMAVILLGYISLYQIHTKGSECTLKPFNFAYKGLQEANKGKTLQCSCTLIGKYGSSTFYFNETDTYTPQETKESIVRPEFNLSELEGLFPK